MNEQLKGFLKKASEDGPLKEELGALAGLPEEERAERAAASLGKPVSMCRSRTSLLPKRSLTTTSSTSWQEEVTPAAVGKPVRA